MDIDLCDARSRDLVMKCRERKEARIQEKAAKRKRLRAKAARKPKRPESPDQFDYAYCSGNTPWVDEGIPKHEWFDANRRRFVLSPTEIIERSSPWIWERRVSGNNCVYFLIQDCAIEYVGMATCFYDRSEKHRIRGRAFDRYYLIEGIPKIYLAEVEAFYIQALNPRLNKSVPPCLFDWSDSMLKARI